MQTLSMENISQSSDQSSVGPSQQPSEVDAVTDEETEGPKVVTHCSPWLYLLCGVGACSSSERGWRKAIENSC